MGQTYALDAVARVPMPGDNTAIATQRLEIDDVVVIAGAPHRVATTILEGHRFAITPIEAYAPLLSWGLPFGYAARRIAQGEYVVNARTLEALRGRSVAAHFPEMPNFVDRSAIFTLDEEHFLAAPPTPLMPATRTFQGYRRTPQRGVGTRNFIVVLGTASPTGPFVQALEQRLARLADHYPNIDGIVAVAHTEGATPAANNTGHLLRALAGFMVHPNVGAVLAVDHGWEPVNNALVRAFMVEHGYPLDDVPHQFISVQGSFAQEMEKAEAIVHAWLDAVNSMERTAESVEHLKIALQCGGSDAFSGVSANPLVGWVSRAIVQYGGYANLAETPELIGAEPYVLDKVKDLATAQRFLAIQERFRAYAAWHGSSAEGNPSGGNKFRGLYNITLKSIGAAMKKHPDVRLDAVIDYAEPMTEPGYYFMDSPGLDLESVAGQVASGCNLIFFTTGNGSVTNFPFVPTLKVVTTTSRFELLADDMDVNAGAYLDGTSMELLGEQMLDLTVDVASGLPTAGERAGHAQVQIWRNWRQHGPVAAETQADHPGPSGAPLATQRLEMLPPQQFELFQTPLGPAWDQVGLIMPTSLCAAQVARLAADRMNRKTIARETGLSRFVALTHTEGCSDATGHGIRLSAPTLLGYVTHRSVRHCVLLEHGCEVVHNDFMRRALAERGLDVERFGWASVQLDGGIARVMDKIEAWFEGVTAGERPVERMSAGLGGLRLGLLAAAPISTAMAKTFSLLTRGVVSAGGTVIIGQDGHLPEHPVFAEETLVGSHVRPSLAYAAQPRGPGFHWMETESRHPTEIVTGLGAAGVDVVLAFVGTQPVPAHPLIPVIEVATEQDLRSGTDEDFDLVLGGDASAWPPLILEKLAEVASGHYVPRQSVQGNVDFQITRGFLGISL